MTAKLIHSTVLQEEYNIFRIFHLFFFFAEQQLQLKYTQCFRVFDVHVISVFAALLLCPPHTLVDIPLVSQATTLMLSSQLCGIKALPVGNSQAECSLFIPGYTQHTLPG